MNHCCWIRRIALFLLFMGNNHVLVESFSTHHPSRLLQHSSNRAQLLHALPNTSEEEEQKKKQQEEEETFLQKETFGGYTVKQRLREEVEAPFRQVRLFFFASTAASALTALYFSSLSAFKASIGGYGDDVPPLQEALQTCGINLAGVIVCSFLAYREWNVGNANLARIAKGGALAELQVVPATATTTTTPERQGIALSTYRRKSRILICAGGIEYITELARSLNSDQLADENILPQRLQEVDVIVVPVLLLDNKQVSRNTRQEWNSVEPSKKKEDRNFDINRSNSVIAFPLSSSSSWTLYLESEIDTAEKQGFDYMKKGLTITVKKNGKILRRATGQPQWGYLIGAMETLDGSRFGMPGDSEKYGGP